jgi:uncharacterized protein (TIGR03437 family)
MTPKAETFAAAFLLLAVCCTPGYGQVAPPTILNVDVENHVQYFEDISDASRFATNPGTTTPILPRNFVALLGIGDIVAVNGQLAKGALVQTVRIITLRPVSTPGQGISDIVRNAVATFMFEILKSDGTPIGTVMMSGLAGGSAAPGAPLDVTQGNLAIVGGTGAFLGARGQAGQAVTSQTIPPRQTSITEDPANRRRNGGGRTRFVLHVIPLSPPQIVMTSGGPAVTHASDFSLVTASKPASPGETLSLFVTGLGPTRPGVDPGQPFPSTPLATVNSAVQVTVNGRPAEVLDAVGFPGQVDTYQVNVRIPSGTTTGAAQIHVSAAWINGAAVRIPIQ